MFWTRLISGVVLIILALVTIIIGGPVLLLTLTAVSLIGMNELYRAAGVEKENTPSPDSAGRRGSIPWLAGSGYAGCLLYYGMVYAGQERFFLIALLGTFVLLLAVYVFTWPRYDSGQVMAAFFGLIYTAVMLSFIYQVRMRPGGHITVWLIFLCSWGCDTCAYCVGMLIGKHKMSPRLSPKKSIEGAVGGVAGAAVLGAVYAVCMGKFLNAGTAAFAGEYALICAAGSLLSMVGDLAASAIKRNHNLKDYGKLIPGHGGILDRFDSVILTAPLIWLLSEFLL